MTAVDGTKVDAFVRRIVVALTATLTALVVLTGCGGSASSSSTMSATAAASTPAGDHCDPEPCQLTRAEFAAELDALCLRGNAAVKSADASFDRATKTSDYARAAAALESALRQFPPYQFAILGLTPPVREGAAFTRYVDLTRRIHGLSERIVAAGRIRDNSEAVRLSQIVQGELATRTRTAVDLGTKSCGD